jgi:isochorismate synthase
MSLTAGEAPTDLHGLAHAADFSHRALSVQWSPDPLAVFAAAGSQRRFCWIQPEEGLALVGIGAALLWRPESRPDRFAEAAGFASRLVPLLGSSAAGPTGESREILPGPILCGGFAFDSKPDEHLSPWADFGAGALVVPELTGIAQRGVARWFVTARRGLLDTAGDRAVKLLRVATETAAPCPELVLLGPRSEADDSAYLATIAAALEGIGAGTLNKVVPARQVTTRFAGSPGESAVAALLRRLADRYPTATTFAVGDGPLTLLGATPELLIRTRGGLAETDALAGSCERGDTPEQDAALARAMLASRKERHEHDAVVEHLRSRLTAAGVSLEPVPAEPDVRMLPGIQHLHTPLRGRVDPAPGAIFGLAGSLHPTPAVGGLPAGAAIEFLRTHEPAGRGWFAGPVGWMDLAGNGELCLALRSGLADSSTDELSLFAGSGVVAGSDPVAESAETDTKLNALPAVTDGGSFARSLRR